MAPQPARVARKAIGKSRTTSLERLVLIFRRTKRAKKPDAVEAFMEMAEFLISLGVVYGISYFKANPREPT